MKYNKQMMKYNMKNYIDYLDKGGFARYLTKPLFNQEIENTQNGSWFKGIYESIKQFGEQLNKKQYEQREKINVNDFQKSPSSDWIEQHTTLEYDPNRGYLLVYTNNSSRNNSVSTPIK